MCVGIGIKFVLRNALRYMHIIIENSCRIHSVMYISISYTSSLYISKIHV